MSDSISDKVLTTTAEPDGVLTDMPTTTTNKEKIHAEYLELIDSLKQRNRKVRECLEKSQHMMQRGVLTKEEKDLIDDRARQFMRMYVDPSQGPYVNPATVLPDTKTKHRNEKTKERMPPLAAAIPVAVPGNYRKPRRVLIREVEELQDLVKRIALLSPGIKHQITRMVEHNEVLMSLDILSRSVGGSEASSTSSRYTARQQHQNSKSRKDTELSSGRNDSYNSITTDAAALDESTTKSTRKRNKRHRKRDNKVSKTLQTELENLRKYINQIVLDFLDQTELPIELRFTGNICDLEEHAKKLVNAGLGRIVEDEIRVNRKNNRQSFITMSNDREGTERDGIVLLPVARRYAFEGDIVRAFVLNSGATSSSSNNEQPTKTPTQIPQTKKTLIGGNDSISLVDDEENSDGETESLESDIDLSNDLDNTTAVMSDNCPKAFVIAVIKQTELRQIVGTISFVNPVILSDNKLFYKLKPHDMRVPMAYVSVESCVPHFTQNNGGDDVCGMLYLAHVLEIDTNGHCIAELLQQLGYVGNLEAEIKAILMHNNLRDIVPFEERFNEMFAVADSPIDANALKNRLDFRNKCVFTIDPLTARDLDDAVSIEKLEESDTYEVGVHISDVSHYLTENSELDNIVKERSTSIYLVNEVIHMLPKTLCFKCSLLPGQDKIAFSVFWKMNGKGEVISEPRLTRTVINSCTQFAYDHAQKIIDNPNENFNEDDFPTILNGYEPEDIKSRVLLLHNMAREMRLRRYENGSLSINNPKIRFNINPSTGEPQMFEVEELREANHLIEEFMLLANQAVARFIFDKFPEIAILRNHAPPLSKSLKALREKLNNIGFELDYSSSKTIQESIHTMCTAAADPTAMYACLSQLLMKPMARAKYFCTENKTEGADLWHYALSIPIYTHFTSPIRRYPDILVHRLLAAGLNYSDPPQRTTDELHQLTKTANERKYNAKMASDDSTNLFFKRYVIAKQCVQMRAVVMEIFQYMLNVVTLESGHVISINYQMQKVLVDTTNVPNCIFILERNSKKEPLKIQLLSTIDIKLVVWDNKLCGFFVTPDPTQRILNKKELPKHKHQHESNGGLGGSTKRRTTKSESSTYASPLQRRIGNAFPDGRNTKHHNNSNKSRKSTNEQQPQQIISTLNDAAADSVAPSTSVAGAVLATSNAAFMLQQKQQQHKSTYTANQQI